MEMRIVAIYSISAAMFILAALFAFFDYEGNIWLPLFLVGVVLAIFGVLLRIWGRSR